MNPGLVVDLIILGFLLIITLVGAVRGFNKMVLGLLSGVLAVLLTWWLHPIAAKWLQQWGVGEWLQNLLRDKIHIGDVLTQLESGVLSGGSQLDVPDFIVQWLSENNKPEVFELLGVSTFAEYATVYLSGLLVKAIAALATFTVFSIAFRLILLLATLLTKIPVLGTLNRVLGACSGLILGALAVWLVMALALLIGALGKMPEAMNALNLSVLGKWMYENNLILMFINFL